MPQNGDDSCVWLQSGGQDSDCVKASAAQATPGRENLSDDEREEVGY